MAALSLKTKMSLAVSFLVVVLLTVFSVVLLAYLEAELKQSLENEQFTLIAGMADQIDERMEDARSAIVALASAVPPGILTDPDRVQHFLDNETTARIIFDNGIFCFSPQGRMVAETPFIPGRRGKDYSFRDYFTKTMSGGRPYISLPYLSSQQHHHPSVNFTAPVFGRNGKIVGVLAGSLDLMRNNFLGDLSRIRIGQTGYLYLFAADRTMIMHPEKERILKKDVPPGANNLFDRAIGGFEGTGETVNSRGKRMLASFKHLKTADWILAANHPTGEAFAPITKARHYWLAAMVLAVLFSLFMIWHFMKYLTVPIYLLNSHMKHISCGDGVRRPVSIASNDEIGELADTFNAMMACLTDKEKALQKLSRAVEQSPSIVIITDVHGAIEYVNPKFCDVTGYRSDEVIGRNPRFLKSREIAGDGFRSLREALSQGDGWKGELHNRSKDGSHYWVSTSISAITDDAGTVTHYLAVQEDITERKEFEEKLLTMAHHDNLTGLANRNLLLDMLGHSLACAERHKHMLGLLFIDLDHFKQVNDTRGHAVGDQLLRAFAETLSHCVRKSDVVARIGGDEFIIMLTDITSPDDAALVARKILKALTIPFILDGHEVAATASIGIALYPTDGDNDTELLRNADRAMYHAKLEGRNTYRVHEGETVPGPQMDMHPVAGGEHAGESA